MMPIEDMTIFESDDDIWNIMQRVHDAAMNEAEEAIYEACLIDVPEVVADRVFCEEVWEEALKRDLAGDQYSLRGNLPAREVFIATFIAGCLHFDKLIQTDFDDMIHSGLDDFDAGPDDFNPWDD